MHRILNRCVISINALARVERQKCLSTTFFFCFLKMTSWAIFIFISDIFDWVRNDWIIFGKFRVFFENPVSHPSSLVTMFFFFFLWFVI